MFQKGTKRKFADAGSEEEEEEEAALRSVGPLAGEEAMSLRMLSSYSLQRQTLLNMSLVKLQLCHMLVEPNLCRSVLIANTVRHIQEEMTYDLTWQVGAAADALSHAHTQAECLATSDLLCRSALTEEEPEQRPATPFNAIGYGGCGEDEDEEEEEVVVDEDGDVPLSSVASPTPFLQGRLGMGLGPRWQGEPMSSPEEMEDADEFGKGSAGATDDEEKEEEDEDAAEFGRAAVAEDGDRLAKTTEQIFSPLFETNRPTPVPEAALEELFSDVEASYYDLDSMLTGMQGAGAAAAAAAATAGGGCSGGGGAGSTGGGGPKGSSFELLESLSSSHTQTHSQPPLNPPTGCRPDLSELDHIMEIIVGS